MRRATPEHDAQAALIAWAKLQEKRHPELRLLFAIPNAGGFTGGFKKNVGRVMGLKAEGVKPGVPDLLLSVARRGCHGLYIEMKSDKGRLSDAQKEMRDLLQAEGYAHIVCYENWQSVAHYIVNWYLRKGE